MATTPRQNQVPPCHALPLPTEVLTDALVGAGDVTTHEIAQVQAPEGGAAAELPQPSVLTVSVASSGVVQAGPNPPRAISSETVESTSVVSATASVLEPLFIQA